jgi:two-component system response regulator DesR
VKPGILLLDLPMPKHPGLEALRDLSSPRNSAAVRVILLTAAAEKGQIIEALQRNARGVVLKESATQLLLKAIRTVLLANIGWGERVFPIWFNICAR